MMVTRKSIWGNWLVAVLLAAAGGAWGVTEGTDGAPPPAKERVLFFVAHPDDTIACAGTMFLMKDQFELHVGVLTHGERGLGEAGFRDGSTKATRTREEEAAAAMVGAKVHPKFGSWMTRIAV